ncbi:MAG: UDP-N-acetylmuramoyl-L-alanine--D-glutamate ligase [Patescibacteria group bacterium]|nr:UDP-N-acetylmuramoyl-L-alanine--D-glutamate ligase [Patescibacteria group bacterium]
MYFREWFRGKKVTVMGLGLHGGGLGVARWLVRNGAKVTVTDLKSRRELKISVESLMKEAGSGKREAGCIVHRPRFVLGKHVADDFRDADMVIRNPAVRKDNRYLKIAERKGIPVETDVSLFFALCPFSITAVTGTKGKSTTTALIGEIAGRYDPKTVVGGNIRISPFGFLDRLIRLAERGEKGPPIVLEVSSWQLEGLEHHRLSPHIAVVTNIMEDHLNAYSGMAEYARAKSLILAYQTAADFAVVNADDSRVMRMGRGRRPRGAGFEGERFLFSRKSRKSDGCFVRGNDIVIRDEGEERILLPLSTLKIVGDHNIINVLAACAAAYRMGIPARTIAAVVRRFRGVSGRMEDVAVVRGVKYINDTTATMPDASVAAMVAYGKVRESKSRRVGRRIILLAGGADKGLRYGDWAKAAKRYCKAIVLFDGTATKKVERALKDVSYKGPTPRVDSMRQALREANVLAKKGDVVLLSPACASFGIFKNEFDRGDQFARAVKRLKKVKS